MDRFACDLLVHITAPSTVKDDKRYSAIAQSVLHFQPITTSKVIRHEPSSPSRSSNPADQVEDASREDLCLSTDEASSTWVQTHDDALAITKRHERQTLLTVHGRPLYHGFGDGSSSSNSRRYNSGSPPLQRPRTAPETGTPSFEVGVSFTHTSRRRARSEVSSFSNSFSTVPNSLATPQTPDLRFEPEEIGADANELRVRERSSSRGGPQRKKQRTDNNTVSHGGILPLKVAQHTSPTVTFVPSTPKGRHSSQNHYPIQDESRSGSSTLSPSQPLRLGVIGCLTMSPPIPTVDLTTPIREQQAYRGINVEESRISPQLASGGDGFCDPNPGQSDATPNRARKIRELEDEINAPDPPGGQRHFTTHITKTYELLSQRIPISKVFRPSHVSRDVRVLERGYWLFSIVIGTDDDVASSRKSFGHEERRVKLCDGLEAPTVHERLRKFDGKRRIQQEEICRGPSHTPLWTETEFTTFWENISQFIWEGKAGWGSRLVKKATEDNSWEITFFCWGEVLSHTWLALWIISDKLIGQIPMTWVSGDGMAVVRMSGRKRKRDLDGKGSWVKKGEGKFGSWGLGEE